MENKLYDYEQLLACEVVFPNTTENVFKLHHMRCPGQRKHTYMG